MGLKVIDRVCDPGGGRGAVNEDIFGHGERAAWVMDGATGLADERMVEKGGSDAQWLVARYQELFGERANDLRLATRDLVSGAIEDVAREFETARRRPPIANHELPSAGMALVRQVSGGIEYASLGDCKAIIMLAGGSAVSTPESLLSELDRTVLREMARLRRTGEARSHAEARKMVGPALRRNRGKLNTPGGYWVLSIHPEAADMMEPIRVPLVPGDTVTVLLVSDGFYRLVDTFEKYPNEEALLKAALGPGHLRPLLKELRELEDGDSDCKEYPRFKLKDDATALLFEMTIE